MGLVMHRHLINRLRESRENNEEGEYEESDDETVINADEVDPPAYSDIIKKEANSTDMISNEKGHYDVLYQCGHMYR